jgi:hypothetical protein
MHCRFRSLKNLVGRAGVGRTYGRDAVGQRIDEMSLFEKKRPLQLFRPLLQIHDIDGTARSPRGHERSPLHPDCFMKGWCRYSQSLKLDTRRRDLRILPGRWNERHNFSEDLIQRFRAVLQHPRGSMQGDQLLDSFPQMVQQLLLRCFTFRSPLGNTVP